MHIDKRTLRNVFIGVAVCILLYWVLHETARVSHVLKIALDILSPFIIGSVLAFIINVPMRAIEKPFVKIKNLRWRRTISLVLTCICVLLVLALVFWLLIPQVVKTVESLIPQLEIFFQNAEKSVNTFLKENPEVMEWITENTQIKSLNFADLAKNAISMIGNSITAIFRRTVSAIGSISSAVVDIVIGIVFAVYCLFHKETLARQGRKILYAILPEKTGDSIVRVLRLTNSTFSNFLSGQCVEVVILGLMFAISMTIFRMPYMPLVSVLVAVTAFVPIVGAWVGCAFGTLFILVDNPMQAVWFVALFIVIQQIENNLIYPRVVGNSIGLPGMWVLVAVAVGGDLMGIPGMFLMIPAASVLYTLTREVVNNKLNKSNVDREKLKPQPPEEAANPKGFKFLKKIKFTPKQNKTKR